MDKNEMDVPKTFELVSKNDLDGKSGDGCIIANFANGKLRRKNANRVRFGLYRHTDRKSSRMGNRRILVAETDRISYVGDNFGTFASKEDQMGIKYMVGVYSKSSGKMRLYDSTIFNLRPRLPGQEDEDEVDNTEKPQLTFMQKKDLLTDAFGSSKKQRAMTSRLRNKIQGEALDKAVNSALSQAVINPALEQSGTQERDEHSLIPPYHTDATSPQEAYLVGDIISQPEYQALNGPAQVFTDATREQIKTWKEQETYPSNVLFHVSVLPMDTESRQRKACCLMYITYLTKLYFTKANVLKTKEPLPKDIPEVIRKKLLNNFTVPVELSSKTVRAMPARMKDKLACYIIVLSLIMDEFNMDISNLMKDLRTSFQRISVLLRALGCSIKTQTIDTGAGVKEKVKIAELTVPLTFPDPSEKARKARSGRN